MSRKISEFVRPQNPEPYQPHQPAQPPRPMLAPQITTPPQPIRPTTDQGFTAPQATPNPGESLPPVDLESLDTNLEPLPAKKQRKRRFRIKLTKKRVIISIIVLLLLIAGGIFAYLNYTASKVTSGGTILDLVAPGTPLKTDSEGRTNILVFGTSQDDTAHQEADGGGGLWLTDSIMLVSINKNTNTAKMVSIPRDLWVTLDEQCSVGNESKINAVYECAAGLVSEDQSPSDYASKDKKGATALMKTVTTVTGITPQYYAHVNYNVLKQAVDAVGGISVDIKGDGASGIYDTNFDWNCPNGQPYTCKNVYYPKDGTYELDGLHALYLARARADAGAYSYKDFGLARGDFDRQLNQQKIMTALKEKAQSAGVLANPVAVFNLLNALGNNITTSISTGEMKTFLTTLEKLKPTDITSVDLNGDEPVVKTGSYAGQSIVLATSGINDYTSMIALIAKQLSTNPAVAEGANVAIYNGGETAGAAGTLQTKLTAGGLTVTTTGNTDPAGSNAYTIYVAKPESFTKTIEYLTKNLTDATIVKTAAPASVPANDADIVIVINK